MIRHAGTTYHSAAHLRRRLDADRKAFEAQAAVYRRLMDVLEDHLADARSAGLRLEEDTIQHELDRLAGLEHEMQSSADHVAMELVRLAGEVA